MKAQPRPGEGCERGKNKEEGERRQVMTTMMGQARWRHKCDPIQYVKTKKKKNNSNSQISCFLFSFFFFTGLEKRNTTHTQKKKKKNVGRELKRKC